MITFTETDTNVPALIRESKLHNLVTRLKYHTYGLRQENNPVILIEYGGRFVDDGFHSRISSLKEFFTLNEIDIEISDESDNRRIDIGMRIDLRKMVNKNDKPLLAASVLSTIIYCLEDRLDIEQMKKCKLPSIPKFAVRTSPVLANLPNA
jgi:hypothetical protein